MESADVAADDVILASQYNSLRVDLAARNMYGDYILVRDKKNQNTNGGTFTQDDWRTRDITEELVDTGSICSISSNQITLAAGTYRCLITVPAAYCGNHQSRLYNITTTAVILVGSSGYSDSGGDRGVTHSFVQGRFTLAAEQIVEVQHYCASTRADIGFGKPCNFTDEIYTVAEFWREAS